MAGRSDIAAWRPSVSGIVEVFHARFTEHAYPSHTHDAWTLLVLDEGVVRYDLDRREHGALPPFVTLLPPHVPHDGRSVRPEGFRKRVLYLDRALLDDGLVGAAVDAPSLRDAALRREVHQLHNLLARPHELFEAQSRLALIRERLLGHLRPRLGDPPVRRDSGVARRLRDLLDGSVPRGLSLDEAAQALNAHPAHLVRAFRREYGLPPHQYLIGRRLDLARRLLLAGHRPAEAAAMAGFYDQSHLTRHLIRMVGTAPGRYARGLAPETVTGTGRAESRALPPVYPSRRAND
ncbi:MULTISPECIES: AraC family transcriptional regulator [unclassified Pseudofrankia]|uniref:AraC family transcriptional regulator n=1 Tax=unclassified Pseudofrankia TaxID=2994372 RepID=UPI0009F30B4B|nr:AraC family transcriptional regulator [Pseudofrankia sp. BMG5.37]MDT3439518.1 AraC family transcriptional regulator [Pseudofrankia sp. BMG5.37]